MSEITKDDAIIIATDKVLSTLKSDDIKCQEDVRELIRKMVSATQDIIDEHNAICDKSKKWKMVHELTVYQIKAVMLKVFSIKRINMNEVGKPITVPGIFVDNLVLEIAGKSYEDEKGLYSTNIDLFKCLIEAFDVNALPRTFDEILKKIAISASISNRCYAPELIPVKNGIFNYKTKQLLDFSPDYVFLNKFATAYNPNATNVIIHNPDDGTDWDYESWIEELSDDVEVQDLLKKIPAVLLRYNDTSLASRALILVNSQGNNGKGSLLAAWRNLLGNDNHCSISLGDFGKDFALEILQTTHAVLVDESDVGGYLDRCASFKAVVTNDVFQLNAKFKSPINFRFFGRLVFCINDDNGIRVKDKSDSFYRRLLPIRMDKCFSGKTRTYIKADYLTRTEVLEYMMKVALESNFYELPVPASSIELLNANKEYNDPIREFWCEVREKLVWNLVPFTFLHQLYTSYMKKYYPSATLLGKTTFTNDLLNVLRSMNDDMWFCDDKSKQVTVTKDNMCKPEPLILEYQLGDWMNKTHKGNNIDQICMPGNLSAAYRGLQRIK